MQRFFIVFGQSLVDLVQQMNTVQNNSARVIYVSTQPKQGFYAIFDNAPPLVYTTDDLNEDSTIVFESDEYTPTSSA